MGTPPNQVSYLKGYSIDLFSLGLLPKLDFKLIKSHTKKILRELANLTISAEISSLRTMEFSTEFLKNTCLETSIYRL